MANGQSVDRSERLGLVVLVVTDLDWVDFELDVPSYCSSVHSVLPKLGGKDT